MTGDHPTTPGWHCHRCRSTSCRQRADSDTDHVGRVEYRPLLLTQPSSVSWLWSHTHWCPSQRPQEVMRVDGSANPTMPKNPAQCSTHSESFGVIRWPECDCVCAGVGLSGGRGRLLTHVHRASACTLNAVGLLPVSGRGDARVAPPCPTTLCVWRNLPYLTLPYRTSFLQAAQVA